MPERDREIFAKACRIYETWRGVVLGSPEQWARVTEDLARLAAEYPDSALALRLAIGLMETFEDLYRDGKVPEIADYFGREDFG